MLSLRHRQQLLLSGQLDRQGQDGDARGRHRQQGLQVLQLRQRHRALRGQGHQYLERQFPQLGRHGAHGRHAPCVVRRHPVRGRGRCLGRGANHRRNAARAHLYPDRRALLVEVLPGLFDAALRELRHQSADALQPRYRAAQHGGGGRRQSDSGRRRFGHGQDRNRHRRAGRRSGRGQQGGERHDRHGVDGQRRHTSRRAGHREPVHDAGGQHRPGRRRNAGRHLDGHQPEPDRHQLLQYHDLRDDLFAERQHRDRFAAHPRGAGKLRAVVRERALAVPLLRGKSQHQRGEYRLREQQRQPGRAVPADRQRRESEQQLRPHGSVRRRQGQSRLFRAGFRLRRRPGRQQPERRGEVQAVHERQLQTDRPAAELRRRQPDQFRTDDGLLRPQHIGRGAAQERDQLPERGELRHRRHLHRGGRERHRRQHQQAQALRLQPRQRRVQRHLFVRRRQLQLPVDRDRHQRRQQHLHEFQLRSRHQHRERGQLRLLGQSDVRDLS